MKYFFKHSGYSLFSLLIITGIYICAFGVSQKAFAQDCPPEIQGEVDKNVTVCSLWYALRREVLPIEQRNRALTRVVQNRGIKFVLTEDEIQLFKEAGANDALIAAISKESAKLEKTAFGYDYLGRKYLDLGRKYRALEEKFSKAAKESRRLNNTEEALKNEEEAKKNNEEAVNNLEKSVSYFKLAAEIEPTNITPLNNVGVAYDIAKKYDDALVYFTRVIDLEPTASRYVNRGTVYEKRGLSIPATNRDERKAAFDKAIEDYTRALFLDPTNTSALKYRADAYKFWGRKDEYEADMKRLDDIRNGRISP